MEDIAERRRTEEERDRLFNLSIDLLCVAGFDGYLKDLNPAWTRTLGWSEDELKASPWLDFVHPDDRPATLEAGQQLLRGEPTHDFENRYRCKDGSYRWLSWNSFPLTGEQMIFAVVRDVTQQKEADRALVDSEQRFRNIVSASPMGMHMYELRDDDDLVLIDANEAADELTGVETGERIGMTIEEAFPNLAGTEVPQRYREIARTGATWKKEDLFYEDNQISGAFEVHALRTGPDRMAVMFFEITDRKRAEEDIRKFKTISDHATYGAAIADADGILRYVNPALAAMHGRDLDEMIGSHISICHAEDYVAEMNELIRRVFDDGGIAGEEVEHVRRDGTRFTTLMSVTLITDETENRPLYLAGTMIDITERKDMEERLRQSQKLESIGHLAGGVAHDFNNMLGGIIGAAELLKAELDDHEDDRAELVDVILDAAERTADLTTKLLSFSRKGRVISKPVDLHATVLAVVELLKHSIDRRITVMTELEAEMHTIVGDPSQLQNAILNLCINARDAMPRGGTLMIVTENVVLDDAACSNTDFDVEPGDHVRVSITDTGIGMSRETLEYIFDPFFTTKGPDKGTGLGLAAVYGTVKDHNGLLQVDSEPGRGTAFHLCLPLGKAEVREISRRLPEAPRGSGRILVIDDEPVVRTMANAMLKGLGYEVLLAEDGIHGIEVYKEQSERVDLVLLDMVMPRMNGEDCFRELQQLDPEVKVLMTSGFPGNAAMEQLETEGLLGIVRKPFRRKEIAEAMINALRSRR